MRAVIVDPLPDPAGGVAAEVNLLRRARLRTMRSRLHRRDCCLGPDEGESRSALLAKKDKPFRCLRHWRRQ